MGVPVRISGGIPKYPLPWLDPNRKVWVLTPRYSYLNGSDEVFEREFLRQCSMAGVKKILNQLEEIEEKVGGGRLVLLCFEKLDAKTHRPRADLDQMQNEALICHRRLFAKWWMEQTGELIPELGGRVVVPSQNETPPQESLF